MNILVLVVRGKFRARCGCLKASRTLYSNRCSCINLAMPASSSCFCDRARCHVARKQKDCCKVVLLLQKTEVIARNRSDELSSQLHYGGTARPSTALTTFVLVAVVYIVMVYLQPSISHALCLVWWGKRSRFAQPFGTNNSESTFDFALSNENREGRTAILTMPHLLAMML